MADNEVQKKHKKNSQSLKRVQYKAHYNFHKRLRDAQEQRRLQEQLETGDFDLDESPLVDKSDVADQVAAEAESKKKGSK
jgi:hypothetical protein